MANKIKSWISEKRSFVYYAITALICWAEATFLTGETEYSFLITLIMSVYMIICFYNALFEGKHKRFFPKVICAVLIIVFANQLYDYSELIVAFPVLAGLSKPYLAVALIGVAAAVLLLVKFIYFMISLENEPAPSSNNHVQTPLQQQTSKQTIRKNTFQRPIDIIRIITIVFILVFLVLATCFIFGRIYTHGIPEKGLDFFKITSFLISYGASFLMILLAVVIAAVTLLELIRFIYSRILLFKQNGLKTTPVDIFSTYAFSIVVVIVLFYLSYVFSGFTMDDFTEIISDGQYLALPLTLLVVSVAFLILVRIVHGTILLLIETDATKVKELLKRAEKKTRLGSRISKICILIIDLSLSTILIALNFVAFIPNFFSILYHFVILEDNADVDPDLLISSMLAGGQPNDNNNNGGTNDSSCDNPKETTQDEKITQKSETTGTQEAYEEDTVSV